MLRNVSRSLPCAAASWPEHTTLIFIARLLFLLCNPTEVHTDLALIVRRATYRPRDAASAVRLRYRNVIDGYANPSEYPRNHASVLVVRMTMIIQLMDWFDDIAGTLEDAARSPRVADEVWETHTWTSELFL